MLEIILTLLGYFAIGFLVPVLGRRMIAAYPCCWHSYLGDILKFFFKRKTIKTSDEELYYNNLKKQYNVSKVLWGFLYMALFGYYNFLVCESDTSIFDFAFLYLFGVAVYIDAKRQIIPDILTFAMLIFAALSWDAETAIINALVIYALTTILALLFYFRHPHGFGGGDIALLAALAAFIGLEAVGFVIVFGTVFMLAWCVWKKQRAAPLAPFIFLGTIIWLLTGGIFENVIY